MGLLLHHGLLMQWDRQRDNRSGTDRLEAEAKDEPPSNAGVCARLRRVVAEGIEMQRLRLSTLRLSTLRQSGLARVALLSSAAATAVLDRLSSSCLRM